MCRYVVKMSRWNMMSLIIDRTNILMDSSNPSWNWGRMHKLNVMLKVMKCWPNDKTITAYLEDVKRKFSIPLRCPFRSRVLQLGQRLRSKYKYLYFCPRVNCSVYETLLWRNLWSRSDAGNRLLRVEGRKIIIAYNMHTCTRTGNII
jgi:hypothetical protein